MGLSKRVYVGLGTALTLALTGLVAADIYVDWQVEGKALWSTVVENVVPLAFGALVLLAIYWMHRRRERQFVATVTKWQFAGTAGIFVIVGWVIGLQAIQGELKPLLIVLQATIGGMLAGTVVGYATANLAETEAAAERERDRFASLFENAPAEAVDVAVENGTVVVKQTNDAFQETFGLEQETVSGEALFDLVAHDSGEERIRDAIASDAEFETETTTASEDGRRYFQVRVVPYLEDRGFVLYTDVTGMKRTQQELERTVNRLERSNQRLQEFAYVASHDLQEPLRMVSSYVDLLESEYGDQFDEEAEEYMSYAVDGAERMQDMIDALLEYSRVRSQGEEFTEVDAGDVLEETLQDLELRIEESGAEVTADDLPTVEADESQLGQLFQNLVENAIDHAGDTPHVHVGAEHRDGEVVFSVADDGPGIPEDQQDAIFEIFEQRDRDSDGTGMGLAICERIVDRHGGEIWVDSEEGNGATFYFTVPA